MAVVAFKGGEIAFEATGSGAVVVLLHGFLGAKEIWNEYQTELSENFRVITIDLPGHGQSSNFGYTHKMEMMAQAVAAVINHLKIRRYFLVGHSMGGYVAITLCEMFPDQIKGLCMFHSSAAEDSLMKKKEREKLIRLVEKNKDLFIQEAIPNLFNTAHKAYKKAIDKSKTIAKNTTVQGIIAALEGMKIRKNKELILKFAPYSILYIIGAKDNVLPAQKLIAEVAYSKSITTLVLENAGHMGFIEAKEECLNALKKFFKIKSAG